MLRKAFHSAVTAYVLMFGLFFVSLQIAHRSEQHDIHRNCVSTQHDWDTFQHLIDAALHPPSRAGQKLTAEQTAALADYRQTLIRSVGTRPDC